jgi:hypothetical protein
MRVRMEAWEKTSERMPTASTIYEGLGTRLAGCLEKRATFALPSRVLNKNHPPAGRC